MFVHADKIRNTLSLRRQIDFRTFGLVHCYYYIVWVQSRDRLPSLSYILSFFKMRYKITDYEVYVPIWDGLLRHSSKFVVHK